MGMPISAINAEFYLKKFESKIVRSITHTHDIEMWVRYVDDILVI